MSGAGDPISGAGPIRQTAALLFYGWGYNYYRAENQLRADDLLIRAKVGGILSAARAHLKDLENAYRRTHLPAPSREQPFPDRACVDQARRIEHGGVLIEQLATKIQSAPCPANDKIWQRHRQEKGLLTLLQGIDVRMVDSAIGLHDLVVEWDTAAAQNPEIENLVAAGLKPLQQIVQERAERLTLLV